MTKKLTSPTRVLFVCLGNIIRSPLAARLFEREIKDRGLENEYEADAAGTADYHVGQEPDPRMVRTAARRGFHYTYSGRQIERRDLDEFDLIIPMDLENKADVEALVLKPEQGAKIHLLREFDPEARGAVAVPDPWYGGPSGFEDVYDIIERSVRGLLDALEADMLS